MRRPVHFEIHADDPERACDFYQSVFGWSIKRWGEVPYWLIETGSGDPGIDGALLPRQGPTPAADNPVSAYVITIDVEDVDATVRAIEAAGGSVAMPRHAVPGIGWHAYCKDTEGNVFGVMQPDSSAADPAADDTAAPA